MSSQREIEKWAEPVGFYIEKDGLTGAEHKAQLDQFFSAKGLGAIYCLEIILIEQTNTYILQTRINKT